MDINEKTIDDKQIKIFQKIMEAFNPDALTTKQSLEFFETVLKRVAEIEKRNIDELNRMNNTISLIMEKLKSDTSDNVEGLKGEVKALIEQEHNRLRSEHQSKMGEIDVKMSEVRNGKDADENRILENLKAQIKIPTIEELKDDLPVMGNEVRDALEVLQGEERLDVSAIKGLEELIAKNKTVGGGGGFSKIAMDMHFIYNEIPSGTIDGVNDTFTLSQAPNPVASLKIRLGSAWLTLTEDFTISGRTITFNTLAIPQTGQPLRADYTK